MLNFQVFADEESLSQHAAQHLVATIQQRPNALLCLATGATPLRTYALLRDQFRRIPELTQQLRILKLDEWGGLPRQDPATCEWHLQQTFGEFRWGERYESFASCPDDPQQECSRIRDWLDRHGPIDVCVLGLGLNGHLGFNEPAAAFTPHAHIAALSDTSLTHAMLQQTSNRPSYGLTLGMADICQAREILLLVSGQHKQATLAQLKRAEVTPHFPASILHLHSHVNIWCDAAAAGSAAND